MTNLSQNICTNCGETNPLYYTNCGKCKHYIRATVVNIDLWSTFWRLFESPKKALVNIIYAEHKNFVSFLLIFLSTKLFILSAFTQSLLEKNLPNSNYQFYNFLILFAIYTFSILFFVKLFTIINKKQKTRFKDNLAIVVYSFTPILFSLFFLTPVEYGIFGIHWFIFNPSPFIIKSNIAYVLVLFEGIMFIWSVVIIYKGFNLQTNSNKASAVFTFLLYLMIVIEILFIPYILI